MQWLARATDVLFPPLCLGCNKAIDAHNSFCGECFSQLSFLPQNCCIQCAIPLSFDMGGGSKCLACLKSPPPFDEAISVCRYDKMSAGLITRLKYSDKLHLAPAIAAMMAKRGAELLANSDFIVPVPLHFIRQWRRLSNQSAQLAKIISSISGKEWRSDILKRHRISPPQASLSRKRRHTNVSGVFSVNDSTYITGKKITLIDDVMTTGATLSACAKTLKDAGAASVGVLVFARTCLD